MKQKLILLFSAIMLVLLLAACGAETTNTGSSTGSNQQTDTSSGAATSDAAKDEDDEPTEVTITHQLGEATISINPEKVVVFDFGVLDTLDKLGVEVTGVPQANIPPYLAKYEDSKYENVGSLKELDFEKIAEISPDLIIISGRQQEAYEELTKIGPTLYMALDTSNYMESFESNMTILGQIFDKSEVIEEELAALNTAIEGIHAVASNNEKNALIVLANDGNLSAYGPGSRFGILHDVFGLAAVDENIEVSTHGMNVSFEYIVEMDPDYLFVVDRNAVVSGDASAAKTIENELVANTKAYQNGNIIYLDPNYWYLSGGGLVSVSEMIKAIEEALN